MKEYTADDIRRLETTVKALQTQVTELRKREGWLREDADMCRIYMTKWQMAYENEKAECRKWRDIATRLYDPLTYTEARDEYITQVAITGEVES